MIKKAAIATGIFAVSALAAASMAFAQTAPATSTTVTPTVAAMQKTVPAAAPATGRAN